MPRVPTPTTGDELAVHYTAGGFVVSVNGHELRGVSKVTFDQRAGDLVITLHGSTPSLPPQHGFFVAAPDMADFIRWRMAHVR